MTISAVTLARSDPVGVTAMRSPWRADTLPAVPITSPAWARWRLALATASRSSGQEQIGHSSFLSALDGRLDVMVKLLDTALLGSHLVDGADTRRFA